MHNARSKVEIKFAESLVAQMLQRSGASFSRVERAASQPFDFLVRADSREYAIEVKYTDQPASAMPLWAEHQELESAGSLSTDRTFANSGPSPEIHLVVVTGTGDKVYTDEAVASLLAPDTRTEVSVITDLPD